MRGFSSIRFRRGCVGVAGVAETPLTVGTAHATADAELPATVGVELGIFKKHGLDIKLADLGGDSRVIQGMTAGSIDIGVGGGSGMALIVKGAPMIAVCEDSATQPYFAIAVAGDSPLHKLADLKGKKIGITRENSTTDWLARQLPRSQGWPADAITLVALGGDPASGVAALRNHLVDADIGGTMDFAEMEDKKVVRILAPVSDYIGKVASGILYASNHIVEHEPRRGPRLCRRLAGDDAVYGDAQGRDGEGRGRHHPFRSGHDRQGIRHRQRHVHRRLRLRCGIARGAAAILRRAENPADGAGHVEALYDGVSAEAVRWLGVMHDTHSARSL